jgi:hypothetical protein
MLITNPCDQLAQSCLDIIWYYRSYARVCAPLGPYACPHSICNVPSRCTLISRCNVACLLLLQLSQFHPFT